MLTHMHRSGGRRFVYRTRRVRVRTLSARAQSLWCVEPVFARLRCRGGDF